MNLSIVGTGYVGLVTGACLAETGHRVVCVDKDAAKVDKINHAELPMQEPGLEDLLKTHIDRRLTATVDLERAVLDTDVTFITVGTPIGAGGIDLTSVTQAAEAIGAALRRKPAYHLVVVKSTVVPGTTDQVIVPVLEAASGKKAGPDFGVAVNPEFLTEGEAVQDFMTPDRLVLGVSDRPSVEILDAVYDAFPHVARVRTNLRTAEMIKYSSNALLATLISFSNELANLCTALTGIDAADVMRGVHLSKYFTATLPDGTRFTPPITAFLWPGCGFGGSCLPKDVQALVAHGRRAGQPMPVLEAVLEVNAAQPARILMTLKKHVPALEAARVAVLGLAFRPGTDDMRESPAIAIIQDLLAAGARVRAYDPAAGAEARRRFPTGAVTICASLEEALEAAEAVVLVTRWDEFRRLPRLIANLNPPPLVIDGRRMLEPGDIARYDGIGL
jgi:UDPglucose 6-dehydrogenase